MNPSTRAVLVPPRPNLGPDPLPSSGPSVAWLVGLALILPLAVAAGLVIRRRLKRRRRAAPMPAPLPCPAIVEPSTPQDWMIVWSDAVRDALVARFGPAWRAKTTEEIATDVRLEPVLGAEQAAILVAFLNAADRIKFATGDAPTWLAEEDFPARWQAWVAAFTNPDRDTDPTRVGD